jgi:hypothetical protein
MSIEQKRDDIVENKELLEDGKIDRNEVSMLADSLNDSEKINEFLDNKAKDIVA